MGRVPPWLPGSAGGAGEIRNSVDLTQETKRWSATAATSPSRGRGRGAKADVPGNPGVYRPAAGAAGTGMTGRWGSDAAYGDGRGAP